MTPRLSAVIATLTLSIAVTAGVSAQSPEERLLAMQLAAPKLASDPAVNLDLSGTPLKDIVAAIAKATGVTVRYHSSVTNLDAVANAKLANSIPADAFRTVLGSKSLTFKELGAKAVFVYPDTPANREKFTDAVQTFPITRANINFIQQTLNKSLTVGPDDLRPTIVSLNQARTISVRATPDMMAQVAKIIAENDK